MYLYVHVYSALYCRDKVCVMYHYTQSCKLRGLLGRCLHLQYIYMYVCDMYGTDLLSMCWIIEVLLCVGVGYAGWVTTYDVKSGASIHASLAVPLNLDNIE